MNNETVLTLIEEVAPQVADSVRKVTKNVYNSTFGERISNKRLLENVKTSIFEVLHENPELRGEDLIKASAKKHKHYLWSRGTATYDKIRRETPSITRAKLFAENNRLPWGAELHSVSWDKNNKPVPINIEYLDEEKLFESQLSSVEMFNILVKYAGTELATIFVLHHGFKWPLLFLTKELLGITEESDNFQAIYSRVIRMMKKMTSALSKEVEGYL